MVYRSGRGGLLTCVPTDGLQSLLDHPYLDDISRLRKQCHSRTAKRAPFFRYEPSCSRPEFKITMVSPFMPMAYIFFPVR